MSNNQIIRWCFTSYNIELWEEFAGKVERHDVPKKIRYIVFQQEVCPLSGREHIQGYVEFKRSQRMNSVKKILDDNTLHLEPAMGTSIEASNYCKKADTRKEGTEFIEWGQMKDGGQGLENYLWFSD